MENWWCSYSGLWLKTIYPSIETFTGVPTILILWGQYILYDTSFLVEYFANDTVDVLCLKK